MTELIGWTGALLFAICGIPQAWKSYTDGHSDGMSHSFIWLWFFGEVLTVSYMILIGAFIWPLFFNYAVNFMALLVIIKYKYARNT